MVSPFIRNMRVGSWERITTYLCTRARAQKRLLTVDSRVCWQFLCERMCFWRKMASNTITRLDIAKYLNDKDIKPSKSDWTNYYDKFIHRVCSKLAVKKSELPQQIFKDICKIKDFYPKCQHSYEVMIRKHAKFFSAEIKPKRSASLSSTSASVEVF